MASAKRPRADHMKERTTISSGSEYEYEGSSSDDEDDDDDVSDEDDDDGNETESVVKRELTVSDDDDSDDGSDDDDSGDDSDTEDEKLPLERRVARSAEVERAARYDGEDGEDDGDETESEAELGVKRELTGCDESDDDDSDESDDESDTEDERPPLVEPERRVASSAEVERAARYEAEEHAILVKEERGARGLFGDDDEEEEEEDENEDEDGDAAETDDDAAHDAKGAAYSSSDELKESLFSSAEDDKADEKDMSFTESLLASASHDGDDEEAEDLDATEQKPLLLDDAELYDAKSVLWNVLSHVSQQEKKALRRGRRVDGPPMENPIAHGDEFKRKFRWPVRLMNLPTTDFAQDPVEIYNDYEVALSSPSAASEPQQPRRSSAFAQVPRPLVEAVAAAAASTQRQSRKRKRSQPEAAPRGAVSAAALTAIARIGERFADELLESLVSANAAALQGANDGYSQRSWTPLPVSRKPVANWRFVLENVARQSASGEAEGGHSSASLRPETLQRIRERLKTINALPWRPEDNELLSSPPTSAERGAGASSPTSGTKVLML